MEKKTLLTSLFCLFFLAFAAQDQIFKTDNTRMLVKILEVGTEEIKYKRFDNLSGPTYLENKSNVILIIFENGQHQVITTAPAHTVAPAVAVPETNTVSRAPRMNKVDSLTYFRHANTIGINFLYFFNNELGFTYRRDFYTSNFNVIIPIAFGVSQPNVTQAFYFGGSNNAIHVYNKMIETGIGINYYPSLETNVNFYIGPLYRYIQYNIRQSARTNSWPVYLIAENNTSMVRHTFSITSGLVFRTRSRLSCNLYMSLGFKNDQVTDPLTDTAGNVIVTIPNPLGFYWWNGFEVGFSF